MLTKITRLTCAFCFSAGRLALAIAADGVERRLDRIEGKLHPSQAYSDQLGQLAAAIPASAIQPTAAKKGAAHHTARKQVVGLRAR